MFKNLQKNLQTR